MENTNQPIPSENMGFPPPKPIVPTAPFFPTGKREFIFAFAILGIGWLLCNSVFYAGLNLGFAVISGAVIGSTVIYLLSRG